MGTYTGTYTLHERKRESRRRRNKVLSYIGLTMLAAVTMVVVALALQR